MIRGSQADGQAQVVGRTASGRDKLTFEQKREGREHPRGCLWAASSPRRKSDLQASWGQIAHRLEKRVVPAAGGGEA